MDHLLRKFGFLEFSASNVVFGPMRWGPVRKIARKAYDVLGLHGKVSLPQSVNRSKTKAVTTIRSMGEGVSINLTAGPPPPHSVRHPGPKGRPCPGGPGRRATPKDSPFSIAESELKQPRTRSWSDPP